MSATLTYNGQVFGVMVEAIETQHMGMRPIASERLSALGIDGCRWIEIDDRRPPMTRVVITGILIPPTRVEMPFVRRDRFTLAALLPKSEPDDFDADDINDWD
jgi:hypothetical protein